MTGRETRNNEEKELAARAAGGDIRAFEELIMAERPRLYSFALAMSGGNHADAADVLQEAFIKAFVNIRRFRGDSSFGTWLWRIVHNEFLNYRVALRSRPIRQEGDDETVSRIPSDRPGPAESLITAERRAKVLELVALLPPKYRETIVMIDIREQSYDETAELLGISMSALKTRLMRAREKFSELVRKRKEHFI